jgi:4-hydroxythreonine-4-phosphate dehydrogenase
VEPVVRLIADDLTGAADAGVAFARLGAPVALLLDAHSQQWPAPQRRAIAVDTDTRDAEAAHARTVVGLLGKSVSEREILFKKVDSALRGQIAAELTGLRDALPGRVCIFAPAFPATGRVTRRGVQYVHGVAVHDGDAWAAERTPPPRSLVELLHGVPVALLSHRDLHKPRARLARTLAAIAASGRVAICDAESDDDLRRLVGAGQDCGWPVLWAGSAGLATALAREIPSPPALPGMARAAGPDAGTAFLAVVGSTSPVSQRQVRALAAGGAAWIDVPVNRLSRQDPLWLSRLSDSIAGSASRGDTVVSVSGDIDPAGTAEVRRGLVTVTAQAAATAGLLLLTGGATARAVLARRGVTTIEVLRELAPGVVLSATTGVSAAYVISKSGAFGDDQLFSRAVATATGQEERP